MYNLIKVRQKPDSQEAYLKEVSDLLNHKYRNQTGIIYTTTVKDTEDTCTKLRYFYMAKLF